MLKVPNGYKRITKESLNDEGCLNLLEAYVGSLAEDYRTAIKVFISNKKDKKSYEALINIRNMFLSDYFSDLTGLDGKAIIEQLDRPYLGQIA